MAKSIQVIDMTLFRYIVLVFASLACLQSAMCLVWLVTAESSEAVFGWTNADLSVMQVWIYIMFIVGQGPFAWLMQNKGMTDFSKYYIYIYIYIYTYIYIYIYIYIQRRL